MTTRKKRPLDSGRRDSRGRTVRVSDSAPEIRSDAPPPPTDPQWTRPDRCVVVAITTEKYPLVAVGATEQEAKAKMAAKFGDDILSRHSCFDTVEEAIDDIVQIADCPIGGSATGSISDGQRGKRLDNDQNEVWYCAIELYDTVHGVGRSEHEARKAALSAARKYLHTRTDDRYRTLDDIADYFGANTQRLELDTPTYLWS